MISDKIVQKIESLRHNTTTRIQKVQESKVPAIYKMQAEIQQTYTVDGQEYVYNNGRLILLIRNLPIYYNLKRSIFTDNIANMINNKELHPFMIFLNGKFVKWSDINLVHDFKDRYILLENFDLSSSYVPKDKTSKVIDIYNQWERFSHNTYGIFPANAAELTQWSYDELNSSITCTANSTTYLGLVSNEKYSDYIHQVTVSSTDPDDDVIGTVIAFHKDETGKEHTLSAIRSPGTNNGGLAIGGSLAKWMIVYNLGQSNQKVIADGGSTILDSVGTGWQGIPKGCTIKIERTETTVTATTSQFGSNILEAGTKLTIDLNSDPVLQLFIGAKQYGYSCFSQNQATFKDLSFVDLKDNIILPQAEMVTIPFGVDYKENQTVASANNIFTFDSNGLCISSLSGVCTTIDLADPYIYYESQYLTPSKVQSTNMNASYKISKVNPLLFKDGMLYTKAKIDFYGLNTFLVDNGDYVLNSMQYKLFYYIYGNESKDNILNVYNRDNAISTITDSTVIPEYIDNLAQSFDFEFDASTSYSQNILNALDYIIKYNPNLLNDIYSDANKIDVKQYTGSYILSLVKNGYVTMLRGNKGRVVNYPLIFVNGSLYQYYHYITYKGNNFIFPVIGINPTDVVEIMMFKDIDNRILENTLLSENGNEYYLDSNIDIKNLRIFSRDSYNRAFDIPNTNYLRYNVAFTATRVTDSKINITLADSYYYDRKLYFASSRQFRYYYVLLKESTMRITLPEDFAYCKNKNSYMIFVNGKKIDNADFQFTNVDKAVPFDDLSLYISVPLNASDKVDIFYVPDEMQEIVAMPTIPTNGNVFVDKNKLPYMFNKDLYFVFVNGKKINNNDLLNVSSTKVKILNNIGTIKNLSIIKHVTDDDIINQLFKDNNNIYDSTIDSMNTTDFDSLYSNGNNINNVETDIKTGQIDSNVITDQIIRDYWLRTVTTKFNSDQLPSILSYEYDQPIPYTETDSNGNVLI